jgi:hypothetical protein
LLDDPHRQGQPEQHQHRKYHQDGQPTAHVCSLLARLLDRGDLQFLLWPSCML